MVDYQPGPDLKERYLANFPRKLEAIGRGIGALEKQASDTEALHQVHDLLHKIRGVSGGYGFPLFREAVKDLEVVLKSYKAEPQKVRPLHLIALRYGEQLLRDLFQAYQEGRDLEPLQRRISLIRRVCEKGP